MAKTKPFGTIYSTGTPSSPAFFIRWWEGDTRKKLSGFTSKKEAAEALAAKRAERRESPALAAMERRILEAIDRRFWMLEARLLGVAPPPAKAARRPAKNGVPTTGWAVPPLTRES